MRLVQLLVALGLASGWWIWHGQWSVASWAMPLGAITWFIWDRQQLSQLLAWVVRKDDSPEPALRGVWGELATRIRKMRRELTQQQQDAEQRLSEFMDAIQTSPNGVVLLDVDGRIEWSNQTALDLLGIQPERDWMQHVTNLVRQPVFTQYLQGGDHSKEVLMDGVGSTPLSPRFLAVRLHSYGAGRRLVLVRDVTATQQAEAMRRDFVANVSHEIRTPLTVLSGFVETLQTLELNDGDRQRYLGWMAQQSQRMQSLVADLLTLSRLEGSPLPGRVSRLEVALWLAERVTDARNLSSLLPEGGHVFDLQAPANCFLCGSADELTSAVANLLSNAVRYTPPGGHIAVRAELDTDRALVIAVTDTGPGIAPEHIPRLSERFYRVDRSRSRDTGGTGLGLAIVKHVAQRHGGQLQVTSELGKGSCFSLRFPPDRVELG